MIKLNDKLIKKEMFGDGTLKIEVPESLKKKDSLLFSMLSSGMFGNANDNYFITWCYDDDSELFLLQCLVDRIKEVSPLAFIRLIMPYIPNARQDREVSNRLFTLKSFCKIINNMGFSEVKVLDPHSDVSCALIDRLYKETNLLHKVVYELQTKTGRYEDFLEIADACLMFPDAGAAKKYEHNGAIIGNKKRNSEGRIESYELMNFQEGTKKVLIVDDICSYGGTFVAAAKALREKGVEKIYLMVSHCEGNIFKGEVFDYIDGIYTTDSILDFVCYDYEGYTSEKADKIYFINTYRQGEK